MSATRRSTINNGFVEGQRFCPPLSDQDFVLSLMPEWQWRRWGRAGAGGSRAADDPRGGGTRLSRGTSADSGAGENGGRAALRHGNRRREPVHKLAAATRERIVRLRREEFRDFDDQHFTEKLAAEQAPVVLAGATLRRIVQAAGMPAVWQPSTLTASGFSTASNFWLRTSGRGCPRYHAPATTTG